MGERTYTCEDDLVGRPATGKTPNRNLRVADEVWKPALAKAKAEGRPLTEVIVDFLRTYIGAGADTAHGQSGEKLGKRPPSGPSDDRAV